MTTAENLTSAAAAVTLRVPTATAFVVLDAQHRTAARISGRRASGAASDFAAQISGTVGQYVGVGPNGEHLLHCNGCGAMFLEVVPEWDD
jgi:hypothetical protein